MNNITKLTELAAHAKKNNYLSIPGLTPEIVEAAAKEMAELQASLRRCEDCDATMNHIGMSIYECWKCADNESRVRLFHLRKALERHGEDWKVIEEEALKQESEVIQ